MNIRCANRCDCHRRGKHTAANGRVHFENLKFMIDRVPCQIKTQRRILRQDVSRGQAASCRSLVNEGTVEGSRRDGGPWRRFTFGHFLFSGFVSEGLSQTQLAALRERVTSGHNKALVILLALLILFRLHQSIYANATSVIYSTLDLISSGNPIAMRKKRISMSSVSPIFSSARMGTKSDCSPGLRRLSSLTGQVAFRRV